MTEFYALRRYHREPRGFNWPLLGIVLMGIAFWLAVCLLLKYHHAFSLWLAKMESFLP